MDVVALRYVPPAPLSAFVEAMWCWMSPPRPFAKERLMPSGSATLIVNLAEDELRSYTGDNSEVVHRMPGVAITVSGSESFVIDTDEQSNVMGIEFHPGGTWPFIEPAADEIVNRHVSLKEIWGSRSEALRAQLLAARTPREKFAILEQGLIDVAVRPIQLDACVSHAIQTLTRAPQANTIAALTDSMGISARKFSRLFTQQVGLKPKTFARVQRFQQVLAQIGLGRDVDWASVVAQCGYYDQAHFIHDFRAFSGFTPSDYLSRNRMYLRHVPLS